jgi:hypothetical protein
MVHHSVDRLIESCYVRPLELRQRLREVCPPFSFYDVHELSLLSEGSQKNDFTEA